MAWRAYNTVNGQILGETSASGARPLDYQLDALGSVVGTIKTNGTLENTYRYAGYGQQVSKTGLGSDPKFLWVGGWGYRAGILIYIRARHYSQFIGSWASIDPLWPHEPQYCYVSGIVASIADPSGTQGTWTGPSPQCACGHPDKVVNFKGSPERYKCYLKACKEYCQEVRRRDIDMVNLARTLCPQGGTVSGLTNAAKCRATNSQYPVCTSKSNYTNWSYCGPKVCGANGSLSNTDDDGNPANANQGNWPYPIVQLPWLNAPGAPIRIPEACNIGGENCCVECRMRVCCKEMGDLDLLIRGMFKQWKKCDATKT